MSQLNSEGEFLQDISGNTDLIDHILWEKYGEQVRFTVSEFLGNTYFGIRYWYLDLEDVWRPTSRGFSIPFTLDSTTRLFKALATCLSKAELLQEVLEHVDNVEIEEVEKAED